MSVSEADATIEATPGPSASTRPATSKSRGICRYYNTSRGCYQGDQCKFLHGDTERLTPYDKSKTCRFYASGWCRNGDKCWFIHADPKVDEYAPPEEAEQEILCSICYDKPVTFGLLIGCSHVFCLSCIKNWRGSQGKSADIVEAGTTKTCPMCRTPSRYVTPSSQFYPDGDSRKTEAIQKYKNSMARVKCRYFERSRPNKRFCPFGKDCFYKHENVDGTPYVFEFGAHRYMERHERRDSVDIEFIPMGHGGDITFQAMLNRITRELGSPEMGMRDMQRAMLSSVAALFGITFSDDEPSNEDQAIAPSTEQGDDAVVISPPENVDAEIQASIFSSFQSDSPQYSAGVTLDPTSPIFIPSFLDDMRPLPSGPSESAGPEIDSNHDSEPTADQTPPLWNVEDLLQSPAETRSIADDSTVNPSVLSARDDTNPSRDYAPADTDPPFVTDGRGRVVWSNATTSRSREIRRARATSSSATIVPHVKSAPDLSATEESSDESCQQDCLRPPSLSRRLVRQRSLPSVSSAEFVTDGRGRVVFAPNGQ